MRMLPILLRYARTGSVAAMVELSLFSALSHAGMDVFAALAASFLCAAATNYILASRYVFFARLSFPRFASFFAGSLLGVGVNAIVTLSGIRFLDDVSFLVRLGVVAETSKACGIAVAFLVNFCVNFFVVFRRRVP